MSIDLNPKDYFSYCPVTGVFTKIKGVHRNVNVGMPITSTNREGYIQIRVGTKMYSGHRLAWYFHTGNWPENEIDHANGIRTDNRIDNLRESTRSFNMQNKRSAMKNNKTGYLGVSLRRNRGTYLAMIMVNKVPKRLGSYKTPEEAHEAYLTAKRLLHEGNTL